MLNNEMEEFRSVLLYMIIFSSSAGMAYLFRNNLACWGGRRGERHLEKAEAVSPEVNTGAIAGELYDDTPSFGEVFVVVLLIMLPVVVVSALRDNSVGVDTRNYVNLFLNSANYSSPIEYYMRRREDFLFLTLMHVIYTTTGSVWLYLGVMQVLTLIPITASCVKLGRGVDLWKVLLVYYFWFYNDSLNLMRQYVAVAFVMLFFVQIMQNAYVSGFVSLVIAYGFHSSVLIIGVIMIFLTILMRIRARKAVKVTVFITAALLIANSRNIILYLYRGGILPRRYIRYINTFIYRSMSGTSEWLGLGRGVIFEAGVRVLLALFMLYCLSKSESRQRADEYLMNYVVGLIIYITGAYVFHTSYVVRLSVYFDFFVVLLLPMTDENRGLTVSLREDGERLMSVFISLAYWIVHVVIIGSGRTIPYMLR